jgi:hypothetical protein
MVGCERMRYFDEIAPRPMLVTDAGSIAEVVAESGQRWEMLETIAIYGRP